MGSYSNHVSTKNGTINNFQFLQPGSYNIRVEVPPNSFISKTVHTNNGVPIEAATAPPDNNDVFSTAIQSPSSGGRSPGPRSPNHSGTPSGSVMSVPYIQQQPSAPAQMYPNPSNGYVNHNHNHR